MWDLGYSLSLSRRKQKYCRSHLSFGVHIPENVETPLRKKSGSAGFYVHFRSFCCFVTTGMAKYHHRRSLGGHLWRKKVSPQLRSAATLVNLCLTGRLVPNKYIACTSFEFRSRSHTICTNLILFAKFARFRTNHFPCTTLFTLKPPVARRTGDKRMHKKFYGAIWWPFHRGIWCPKR